MASKYFTPQHNRSVDRLLIELHFGEVVNQIANCVCEEELMGKENLTVKPQALIYYILRKAHRTIDAAIKLK